MYVELPSHPGSAELHVEVDLFYGGMRSTTTVDARDVRPFARPCAPQDIHLDRELPNVWAAWSDEPAVQRLVRRGLRLTAEGRHGIDRREVWRDAWGAPAAAPAFPPVLGEEYDSESDGE